MPQINPETDVDNETRIAHEEADKILRALNNSESEAAEVSRNREHTNTASDAVETMDWVSQHLNQDNETRLLSAEIKKFSREELEAAFEEIWSGSAGSEGRVRLPAS